MESTKTLGMNKDGMNVTLSKDKLIQYINIKLASLNQPYFKHAGDNNFLELANDLIVNYREKSRLLSNFLCPADQRIQNFLDGYLHEFKGKLNFRLPSNTLVVDTHGLARMLSIPPDKDEFVSDIIRSYKIKQGVLHNPKNDRRTTVGVFHIAEGGLPVPADKKVVPKITFAKLLSAALNPPKELLQLPYTSSQNEKAEIFVSLLLRPTVSPEVPGVSKKKSMEIRFFAPGNLVSNLDFVESIFGNAGDPNLPVNDAGLDIDGWSGHTGCVILAPHLVSLTKKEVCLPRFSDATDKQKQDGMCWQKDDELYNEGNSFKITARTESGIIVTLIADNYFGYSKKEIKTQISYAANLFGNVEEEHAGGAIAYPSYSLGDEFHDDAQIPNNDLTFSEMIKMYSQFMDVNSDGYAIDKNYPDIIYMPEDSRFDLIQQKVTWNKDGRENCLRLHPSNTYILPAGYKIRMEKNPYIPSWRLIGTTAEGTFCHKPCTVSGGGKSEISKSITDSIIYGPFFVADYENDFKKVEEIIGKDYSFRYKTKNKPSGSSRSILNPARSLGSVIKLLTPSSKYTDEYNKWLDEIPHYIKGLVYIVKRFYKPEWGNEWLNYFSVDIIDGKYGHELKFNGRKLVASYLRIGLMKDKTWRTFKLRQDFIAADKIQMEDDITSSIVIPSDKIEFLSPDIINPAVKFVENCEYRFFQRPDEAINRGYDKQAEADLATPNTFISNFAPLTITDAETIMLDAIEFDKYTSPIKKLIKDVAEKKDCTFFVSSSHPRIFEGKPSQNMRYLQNRPDLVKHKSKYISEVGSRLFRKIPVNNPVLNPVNSVLAGRRNNPPEKNIRSLAVYNPIHYQELPELFMDFICSLTGKSPSTTGAGSEGALTKGPFNSLCTVTDLNNALVSFILTGYDGFTTAAGYVGPKYKVDHDISLLIPEIWSRLRPEEREPKYLLECGCLEKIYDFEYQGEKILASRLGYRITYRFVRNFFGRVFENPESVFTQEMLKPELQNMDVYVDGINNIVEAQKRVSKLYFEDGSVEGACLPLKVLLNIMETGLYDGKSIDHPEIRNLFTREYFLNSDWYKERLERKQQNDTLLWQRHLQYLLNYLEKLYNVNDEEREVVKQKLLYAEQQLKHIRSAEYLKNLNGHLGSDFLFKYSD